MSRLPFDSSKIAGPPKGDSSPGDGAVTVSMLASMITGVLDAGLPRTIRVVGEVSQFHDKTHWYFDIKDEQSNLSCVMWVSAARRAGFTPQVGQQVVLTGRVGFYEKSGRTQFYADRIEPIGAGALDLAYRKLCAELDALGWFDPHKRKPLPRFPVRVAVVTSETGAALQDVLDTIRSRCPSTQVCLASARVQGENAATDVARAICNIDRLRESLEIDVIIVTRGGGSREDLQAFNERIVAEAIHKCTIPVVAAIGHETDTTIAELVADARAATPTQAAMRVVPDAQALTEQLAVMQSRLHMGVSRHLGHERQRLRAAARHTLFADFRAQLTAHRRDLAARHRHFQSSIQSNFTRALKRLTETASALESHRPGALLEARRTSLAIQSLRLKQVFKSHLSTLDPETLELRLIQAGMVLRQRATERMAHADRMLELVGPRSVLKRGYSITLDEQGRVVTTVSQVSAGERIATRVADGTLRSRIEGREDAATPPPTKPAVQKSAQSPSRKPARTSAPAPDDGRDQLDLF